MEIQPIIDKNARTHGLPKSMIVPIAAKSINDLLKYVGNCKPILRNSEAAFEVKWNPFEINENLKIWDLPFSENIHQKKQVWVDVDYKYYRKAYLKLYPEIKNQNKVIDHIYNRKVARVWGYKYLRLLPIDRNINSSSGRGFESLASQYIKKENNRLLNEKIKRNNFVSYADPFDLVKMINKKTGEHPYLDVRDVYDLFYET